MNAVNLALTAAVLLAAAGCGSDAASTGTQPAAAVPAANADSTATTLPDVPERYRRNIGRAWDTASEGRSPTMACTSVIAMAAGNPMAEGAAPDPDGVRAFELCYVDVAARYIQTLLDQVTPATTDDAKNDLCARIASYAVISRTSLGSFADNVQLRVADLDARLLQRVETGVRRHCPAQVAAISGYD
jgi:hypothetical protein